MRRKSSSHASVRDKKNLCVGGPIADQSQSIVDACGHPALPFVRPYCSSPTGTPIEARPYTARYSSFYTLLSFNSCEFYSECNLQFGKPWCLVLSITSSADKFLCGKWQTLFHIVTSCSKLEDCVASFGWCCCCPIADHIHYDLWIHIITTSEQIFSVTWVVPDKLLEWVLVAPLTHCCEEAWLK